MDHSERYYYLFDVDGNGIWNGGIQANLEINYTNALAKGIYFIRVEEWGRNGISEEPCKLTLQSNSTADGLEPNNTLEQARLVQPGVAIHGIIFPTGDRDYYRFPCGSTWNHALPVGRFAD